MKIRKPNRGTFGLVCPRCKQVKGKGFTMTQAEYNLQAHLIVCKPKTIDIRRST